MSVVGYGSDTPNGTNHTKGDFAFRRLTVQVKFVGENAKCAAGGYPAAHWKVRTILEACSAAWLAELLGAQEAATSSAQHARQAKGQKQQG